MLMALALAGLLSACIAPDSEPDALRDLPTDAEVEQYNAQVAPEDRIVCREEVPVGSNIPQRRCRLVRDMEETSRFHREQLRRVLR
jgi:hypothetical protein